MVSLKTIFETMDEIQAAYLRTESAAAAGFLFFRFRIFDDLELVVYYDLRSNEISRFEAVDDFDWDNDRTLFGCDSLSKVDIIAFCMEAMKRQLKSRQAR